MNKIFNEISSLKSSSGKGKQMKEELKTLGITNKDRKQFGEIEGLLEEKKEMAKNMNQFRSSCWSIRKNKTKQKAGKRTLNRKKK